MKTIETGVWDHNVSDRKHKRRERAPRERMAGRSSGSHVGLNESVKIQKYTFVFGTRFYESGFDEDEVGPKTKAG